MLDNLSEASRLAIEAADKRVARSRIAGAPIEPISTDDKSVGNWFSRLCEGLYPKGKAGTDLHYTTGFDERSCQRYAAGKVVGSMDFLRELLRSEQGATWLAGVMDGSDATWWREYQANCRDAVLARELVQKFLTNRGAANGDL